MVHSYQNFGSSSGAGSNFHFVVLLKTVYHNSPTRYLTDIETDTAPLEGENMQDLVLALSEEAVEEDRQVQLLKSVHLDSGTTCSALSSE